MRSGIVNRDLSMPVVFELAVNVLAAGANAGFSRISGISTPKAIATYILGSGVGGMLLRNGVHLGIEYLGSAVGLSDGIKTGGKIFSELFIGHRVGQMIAKDLVNREVTHLDALKVRGGTGLIFGSVAALALWLSGFPIQSSNVELKEQEIKVDEETFVLLENMLDEWIELEKLSLANLKIEQEILSENSTQVV